MINAKNAYTCTVCNRIIVTIDRAEGVTPFMIRCRNGNCSGMARSSCYRNVPDSIPVRYEWFKPGYSQFHLLGREEGRHVLMGGLILRKIKKLV